MSRRLLQRGRYPKDASLYQNPGPVMQDHQPMSSTSMNYSQASEVPLYNMQSMPQSQVSQSANNSWQQTPVTSLPPVQGQHQQNHWPENSSFAMSTQENNSSWNWTPDTHTHNHNHQILPQPQFQNSEVSQQSYQYNNGSYTAEQQYPNNQPGNVDYVLDNKHQMDTVKQNGSRPSPNLSQPSWDMIAPNISQAEHLPWTYSTPQNPPELTGSEWHGYNLKPDTNPVITQSWNDSTGNNWPGDRQHNAYANDQPSSIDFVSQPGSLLGYSEAGAAIANQVISENDRMYMPSVYSNENVQSFAPASADVNVHDSSSLQDAGNNNSALSAFFDHSIEENIDVVTSKSNEGTYSAGDAPLPHNDVELQPEFNHVLQSPSSASRIPGGSENYGSNREIPLSNISDPELAVVNPVAVTEEPKNQEVLEPNLPYAASTSQVAVNEIATDESSDEPLNQQIPAEGFLSTPVQERTGTTVKDETPFKQPVKPLTTVPVVQQEIRENSAHIPKAESHPSFQEVNLETVPDNLEKPPDHDELKKETLLSASFLQHLRPQNESSFDTSKASLWDAFDSNPPCVLLTPVTPLPQVTAAVPTEASETASAPPPTVDAKSSNDVPAVTTMLSNLSIKTPAPSNILNTTTQNEPPRSTESTVSSNDPSVSPRDSSSQETSPKRGKSRSPHKTDAESGDNQRSYRNSPLKEPRHTASSSDVSSRERYPPFRSGIDRDEHSKSFGDMRNRTTHDYDHQSADYRNSNRSFERYPEDSRQRFMENRYASFEDRAYSDRESSRPSSRMSLDDSIEGHPHRDHGYRKHYNSDYERPPSRMSESGAYKQSGSRPYHDQPYRHEPYSREEEYYQRMRSYRGYNYDQYQSTQAPYYGYYDPYRYNYSSYNYGFYDELYRNDPRYKQQLEERYREYYRRLGYDTDYERSSVHSGRSSANEFSKDTSERYPDHDGSSNDMHYLQGSKQHSQFSSFEVSDEQRGTPAARLTPAKFSSAHAFAKFSSNGQLLTLLPKQSGSGPPPLIEIHDMQALLQEELSYEELKQFQGPLVRGETHKNDIIDFCIQKVKFYKLKEDIPDRESYILLWELLILLLRQNGSVAGSDISELLLKDHKVLQPPSGLRSVAYVPQTDNSPAEGSEAHSSHTGDASSPDEGIGDTRDKAILNTTQAADTEKITRKFREFLLFGHKKDALEWAMKHDLWGHALFLASKMDVRTYANVMTRFANSLALNDPLQTLYQLMSGRQPAAVTCIADKQWGDWRPHLAMILSNPSSHSEVDMKSITSLGDTLASQGCLPATHFCYLMAQVEFGAYSAKSSKMVLLCGDHQLPFDLFATNEAIQCTEIYEYAQSLANPGFMLNHLQAYKFVYATRLADHGFLQEALHYCEVLTSNFLLNPTSFPASLIAQVHELASKLKYNDPHYLQGQGELEDQEDPEWLKSLSLLHHHIQDNEQFPSSNYGTGFPEATPPAENYNQEQVEKMSQDMAIAEASTENYYGQQNSYQNTWISGNVLQPQQHPEPVSAYEPPPLSQDTNQYGYSAQWNVNPPQDLYHENQMIQPPPEEVPVPSQPPSSRFNYYGTESQRMQRSVSRERTTSASSIGFQNDRRDSALSSGSDYGASSMQPSANRTGSEMRKPDEKSEKSRSQVGRSWLGGIFSRLLPKIPNQMILPDDKNPTIVWDPVKNCWINNDTNGEEVIAGPLAPPKDVELTGKTGPEASNMAPMPPVAAASTPVGNRFQKAKVKGMRQNYVDILNSSSSPSRVTAAEGLFPLMPLAQSNAKVFVPTSAPVVEQPVMDFVSSQQNPYLTSQTTSEDDLPKAPPMFDPAEFDSRRSGISSVRHTIGSTHRTYPT